MEPNKPEGETGESRKAVLSVSLISEVEPKVSLKDHQIGHGMTNHLCRRFGTQGEVGQTVQLPKGRRVRTILVHRR